MLDTANPSDLLLIQIMTGLRHRYESLNRRYEKELVNDFRVDVPGNAWGPHGRGFSSVGGKVGGTLLESLLLHFK
jgi:hypothetical protein